MGHAWNCGPGSATLIGRRGHMTGAGQSVVAGPSSCEHPSATAVPRRQYLLTGLGQGRAPIPVKALGAPDPARACFSCTLRGR